MNEGGNNNQFINCQVNNSRAEDFVYNTENITYDNYTFTNANNIETITPSGDNTADYSGAALMYVS